MKTVLPSQKLGLLGAIDPDATAPSTVATSWISAAAYMDFVAILQLGALGAGATVDAKLEQATNSAGAGAKDIDGKAVAQLTQAGGDSDKQALINLNPEEFDVNGGFTHFRLSVTVGGAASDIGAVVLGLEPRAGKPEDNDAASVAEIAV